MKDFTTVKKSMAENTTFQMNSRFGEAGTMIVFEKEISTGKFITGQYVG